MKRIKFTKTNIEKLPHPENGKREDKYFASNCSHLCIVVQPQPSLKKSYYAHWGKIIIQPDGTQKRTGRYKYISRFGERTVEEVIAEVKAKIKKWTKERTQSSRKPCVGTLALAFITHGSKGFRVKVKGAKIKYKPITSKDYKNKLETYVLVKTKKQELLSMLSAPFQYNGTGYVTGALRDIPLDRLTKRDIEIWHSRMGSIPTTANRALAILSTAFEWDMKRAIHRLYPGENNPCLRVSKYQETKDKKYLELNKVLEIRKYCMNEQWRDPHFLTFYILLLEVGERLQDTFRMVWRMPTLVSELNDCS